MVKFSGRFIQCYEEDTYKYYISYVKRLKLQKGGPLFTYYEYVVYSIVLGRRDLSKKA